jgi:SSS family solute:Na+ symporter
MKNLGKVLYEYLQDVQSLLAPGIASVFLLGILSKKTTPAAGLTGLIVGFILGMFRLGLKVFYGDETGSGLIYNIFVKPNWLHYEIILFIVVIGLMIIVSYFTRKQDPESIKGLYFGSESEEQRQITRASWNRTDVIHSIIIVAIIVVFYIYFW